MLPSNFSPYCSLSDLQKNIELIAFLLVKAFGGFWLLLGQRPASQTLASKPVWLAAHLSSAMACLVFFVLQPHRFSRQLYSLVSGFCTCCSFVWKALCFSPCLWLATTQPLSFSLKVTSLERFPWSFIPGHISSSNSHSFMCFPLEYFKH